MKNWKKWICGAVAASMLFATGCSGEDTTWSYRSQESALPIGAYIYYMIEVASIAQEKVAEQYQGEESGTAPDSYASLLKETLEDKPVAQYIREGAERRSREYFAVEQEFAARALALEEEDITYARTMAANTIAENPKQYEKNGIAESSLQMILENDAKRQMIFYDIYGEKGEKGVKNAELEGYYLENYAMADVMTFQVNAPANADGTQDSENIDRQAAEDFLQALKDGGDFYALAYEAQQATAEKQGKEPDSVEKPAEGSLTGIFAKSNTSSYGPVLTEGVFATEIGDPQILEDNQYIYVVNRRDILEDQVSYEQAQAGLLVNYKGEEFIALVDTWAQEMSPEVNTAALQKYTPEKLKIG